MRRYLCGTFTFPLPSPFTYNAREYKHNVGCPRNGRSMHADRGTFSGHEFYHIFDLCSSPIIFLGESRQNWEFSSILIFPLNSSRPKTYSCNYSGNKSIFYLYNPFIYFLVPSKFVCWWKKLMSRWRKEGRTSKHARKFLLHQFLISSSSSSIKICLESIFHAGKWNVWLE